MTTVDVQKTISVTLATLLSAERTPAMRDIARRVFYANAALIWIPRNRPLLATSIPVERLIIGRGSTPVVASAWREQWRTQEMDTRYLECERTTCALEIDTPHAGPVLLEVLIVTHNVAPIARTMSCCVLYDEASLADNSALTMDLATFLTAVV